MRIKSGLQLGRIAGIVIDIDLSLLIIFLLITFGLAGGVFPAWHPGWSAFMSWSTALAAAVLFFASVLAHELAHALVGRAHGVVIQRITLFMFGGLAHMENEPPSWRAELTMAIAGPLTSVALGVVFVWLAGLLGGSLQFHPQHPEKTLAALGPVASLLLWLGPVNLMLGVFNLVPGFPLDGGRVLRATIWGITGNLRRATQFASRAGQAFAWLLMWLGLLMILGLRVPFLGGGLIGGLWIAVIGWFLNNAARTSYRQMLVRESLAHVPVARLMQTHFTSVPPELPVNALVEEQVIASGQRAFPVQAHGRLLGLVCLHDLQKSERGAWEKISVAEIMTPADSLVTVSPRQGALQALAILGERNFNQLPVLDHGLLVGLLRREDMVKWLSLHADTELGT